MSPRTTIPFPEQPRWIQAYNRARFRLRRIRWAINLWRQLRVLDREIREEDPKGGIAELSRLRQTVVVEPVHKDGATA